MVRQAADDEARWREAAARGETAAEKAAREAREWNDSRLPTASNEARGQGFTDERKCDHRPGPAFLGTPGRRQRETVPTAPPAAFRISLTSGPSRRLLSRLGRFLVVRDGR